MKLAKTSLILLITIQISACAYIVGRRLPNYHDLTKMQEEVIELKNDYLILFLQPYFDQYGFLHFNLCLKNTVDDSIQVILPNCGYLQNAFLVDNTDKLIVITGISDEDGETIKYFKGKKLLSKIEFNQSSSDIFFNESYESYSVFNANFLRDKKVLILELFKYVGNDFRNRTEEFRCYKVKEKSLKIIEFDYSMFLNNPYQMELFSSFEYKYENDEEVNVFFTTNHYDLPWLNYKPIYEGIYIQKDNKNYKIANESFGSFYDRHPIWIEKGTKFIWGSFLFDASGIKKRNKIIATDVTDSYGFIEECVVLDVLRINN